MRIIGLDLSLRATGIAVKTGDTAVHWETFECKQTGMERLGIIRQYVYEWCCGASLVVLEGLSYGSSMLGHSEIVGLHYLVRFQLWKNEIPCCIVAPTQLKKFVVGKGAAEKALVLREVYRKFEALVSNDNEADAVGLCYFGQALAGIWEPQTVAQRDVLAKVRLSNAKELENLKPELGPL